MPTFDNWCKSPEARLPAPPERDFPEHLRRMFAAHKVAVDNLAHSGRPLEAHIQSFAALTVEVGEGIVQAVDHYLDGFPERAYRCLAAILDSIRPDHIEPLRRDRIAKLRTSDEEWRDVYRMRTSTKSDRFSSRQMFHIPFEERGCVSSQRFSIQGLPCLYLGGSSYVCWEELGRPAFSSSHVARFRFIGPDVHLLDLAYVPPLIEDLIEWSEGGLNGPNGSKLQNLLVSLVVCWPLSAACMTRTYRPEAVFKPEHIVPQLLLQWITQQTDWAGIRYFSTQIGTPRDARLGANFVLPARMIAKSGHCQKLLSLFEVTNAWNFELARGMNIQKTPPGTRGTIEAAIGTSVDYGATEFWDIDGILLHQSASKVTP